MSALGLLVGLGLVWVLGIALACALLGRRETLQAPGVIAWIAGCGWFVGSFALTLWMRVLSLAHVPFGRMSIGLPLALLALGAGWLAWRREIPWRAFADASRSLIIAESHGWRRAAWRILMAWLAVRFLLLLLEVVRRPLYPWDAWTQWATKARVWFELHRIAPFVYLPEWLSAASPLVYVDAAPHYPGTVPLFQVWAATLLGAWQDTLVNLPWWISGVAFGFAIYGYLARERFAPLPALVGTWLVLSFPILDTHIALAGYADLPMSTYLTVAVLAAMLWVRTRNPGHAAVAVLLAIACVLIKVPGKAWVFVMVPGLIVAAVPKYGRRIAAVLIGLAALVVLVLARTEPVILGYRLHLDFAMPWSGLYEAYFAGGNWHLLWYGALALALLAWRDLLSDAVAPYTVLIAAGMMFLLFGFAFTNARIWVEDQTTVNRATLHLAPLVLIWMLVAFRAWVQRLTIHSGSIPASGTAPQA